MHPPIYCQKVSYFCLISVDYDQKLFFVLFAVTESSRAEGNVDDIRQLLLDLGRLGVLAPSSSSTVTSGLVAHELESIDSGYRTVFSIQSSLVISALEALGSEAQKAQFLPRLSSGELIGCFGLTEQNAGSDLAALACHATFDASSNCYVLNGVKTWIANSPIADVFLVWARTEPGTQLRCFLLERSRCSRLSTPEIRGKFSMRTLPVGMIVLDNVMVPEANLLPVDNGFKGLFSLLNLARIGISWGVLGAAAFCFELTRNYTLERRQFDRPLASNQLIQYKLAQAMTELNLALLGCLHVSRCWDEGSGTPEMVSLIKRNSTEKALEAVRRCREMLGSNGLVDAYHVVRHMNNLEGCATYEGTGDVHALVLGRAITGLQAFQ